MGYVDKDKDNDMFEVSRLAQQVTEIANYLLVNKQVSKQTKEFYIDGKIIWHRWCAWDI